MNLPSFSFESWAETHPGKVREVNEDSYLIEPASGLWLVADGMGGYDAGEVASSAIVAHLATLGRPSSAQDQHARFLDRLAKANAEVQEYSRAKDGATVGSTVAALLLFGDQYQGVWAGDSRLYLVRHGKLTQLSRDHSEAQELVEAGVLTADEARTWAHRNVITRAIGITEEIVVDTVSGTTEHADMYLLCSDGLTTHVSDAEIEDVLRGRRPREACERLIELTLERGATDNVTIILVQCLSDELTMPMDTARWTGLR